MTIQLKRREAIRMVQMYYLLKLTIEERGNILLDNGIDTYDDENDKWKEESILLHKNNKHILSEFAYSEFVTNYYIEKTIFKLFGSKINILDDVDFKGEKCVCCGYVIAEKICGWDVCPVCLWEATMTGEDVYSSPNHATLAEYRTKYLRKMNEDSGNILYKKYRK